MGHKPLIAAALVCAVMAPALAYSQAPGIRAEDNRWVSSTGGTELEVTTGATVEFSYPTGTSTHTLAWTSTAKPTCRDVPMSYDPKDGVAPWKGTCTFTKAGTYAFRCNFHDFMTGTVEVTAPTPSADPTETPTATPSPTSTPTTPGTTQPPPNPSETTPVVTTPLTVKLATTQKGTKVRGSVSAQGRLEVTVKLRQRRVGRVVKTANGTTSFSVGLDARARRELKRKRSLMLTVTVAVTPVKQQRTYIVKLRG